jgi:hypothetical protein
LPQASWPPPSAARTARPACQSSEGNWSDNYSYRWSLAQASGGYISGTLDVTGNSLSRQYCGTGTWSVTGQNSGTGQFQVDATPPPGSYCSRFKYMGTIYKPGCHQGNGTWQNFGAAYVNNWSWSKPCDVPTGESTAAVGWSSDGTNFVWDVTLSPSSINFGGRTISENVSTTDGCWFPTSAIAQQTGVQGNPADVNNNGFRDVVGWLPFAVNYYRSVGRAPCGFSSTQQMRIDCSTGLVAYIVNGLAGSIGVTTVSSSRQGQTRSRVWP